MPCGARRRRLESDAAGGVADVVPAVRSLSLTRSSDRDTATGSIQVADLRHVGGLAAGRIISLDPGEGPTDGLGDRGTGNGLSR